MTILVWNCDNLNLKWDQLFILTEKLFPTLIFIQEAKLRRSEIMDLNNRSEKYKFYALLPEDIVMSQKEKMKISSSQVRYGLVIEVLQDDTTRIKIYEKTDNSHYIIERDDIILGNIYMPQRKLGLIKYADALTSIKN